MPDISYTVDMPTYEALVKLRRLFEVGNNEQVLQKSIKLSLAVANHYDDNGILTVLDRQGLPVKINLRG